MNTRPSYHVVGGDGVVYGPYDLTDLQSWIGEGRINRDSQISRSDREGWSPAGAEAGLVWPEDPSNPAQPTAPAPSPRRKPGINDIDPTSLGGIRQAASWLFWISGLSLLNVLLAAGGGGFAMGLGSLAVTFAYEFGLSASGKIAGVALGVLGAAAWGGLGAWARRGSLTAFAIPMVLLALDSLLLLRAFSVLSFAIHLYVLYQLFEGLKQSWTLQKALRAM